MHCINLYFLLNTMASYIGGGKGGRGARGLSPPSELYHTEIIFLGVGLKTVIKIEIL